MKASAHAILLVAFLGVSGAAEAQAVLTCTATGGLVGAPSYRIEVEGAEASLYKVFVNPTQRPIRVASTARIIRYGSVTIFVADLGKSGYALVYSNEAAGRATAVIDINLPTRRELSTQGPITTYACARPSPILSLLAPCQPGASHASVRQRTSDSGH